ncbi:glutamate synthase [Basidiobolus meristosporus CBS 931.73]|uniref:Glutamate synthase [NADH] n=1 Tax=Basidiobolus meristosporus CBS 931.73 TaxID=1314790 RepID=A0A1Y1YHX9_9FUNG|nr:glutamate synthase [Basidiobolus meristosporus CBS 931.73]|eukprot:ORX97575.1 glutamate synthase [Basidiobolus meristosporus CBS 931.73]
MSTSSLDNSSHGNITWADAIPEAKGLYNPEFEKDACGVGFMVQINGVASHKIVKDARTVLCNMTHRGAVGADVRDGDGAGVMTGIPHKFFVDETTRDLKIDLPECGHYAVGNIFLHPDEKIRKESIEIFERIALEHDLKVLGWRHVPCDNAILGPSAKSKEPTVMQPFVILDKSEFDPAYFERQLYVLRKCATHTITYKRWFYICSLSSKNIVYKGQLSPSQVYDYYYDLNNVFYSSHFALVHSRFSTNTFPSWDRAQPMRWCAHNGEINTLRGNKNWMRAREGIMTSEKFGMDLEKLYPIIEEGGSDSAAFDNVLELLVINGVLSLPEAVMMMVPEAWQNNPYITPEKRAFYEWAACLMEPWDGPALFTFSDGRYCGANLDRNGLRPCRYYITKDNRMICASEVGTIEINPEEIISKGRLQPGKMLLVDTVEGRIVDDEELKMKVAGRNNFAKWNNDNMLTLEALKAWSKENGTWEGYEPDNIPITEDPKSQAFGFTFEQLNLLMTPMINDGKEALGSMGNDTALACLSVQPRSIYEYFRQLFAQVTNPPIDPIRENIVMSLECYVGPEGNILEMNESQCRKLCLPSPVLSIEALNTIKSMEAYHNEWRVSTIDITFGKEEGIDGYVRALDRICDEVSDCISKGFKVIVLSDRGINKDRVPISALIACGGVHHHLVRNKQRSKIALIIETGEAREVHHLCVLVGYGADAVCPYLSIEAMLKLRRENVLRDDLTDEKIVFNYRKACNDGILKVMSKMGISTLQSYKGAQIFEALGIDNSVVDRCFVGTATRIKGAGFKHLAIDALELHERAYPSRDIVAHSGLPEAGEYHWRVNGESHINEPAAVANLQDAVRAKNSNAYKEYSMKSLEAIKNCTLRGMLEFDFSSRPSISIDEVEPWTEIVKRFCTGAMSYGSISYEAHTALSIAMNKLGGKSNTGEGGEDPERSQPLVNGDLLRSAIKQVASGRFGVTSYYLSDSDELQIKMAQGAKPGEGGELPGHKVSGNIAKTRKSTPGVGLISPPPHHDIYSIEDLKQLIYDLKCSNPRARVSVKLVSEVGVGIVAAGVAKAKADHILISGHDGGTGASRWTGIRYAGLPWELGLAETHQTLVLNDLRGRVVVQTDGQIKTGRDVAIACLLGAEEWGFATTPLIAMGCIMMRKCHLNTCPVGIATQDPELRKKFEGSPEHVINFFYYVAEELREIMAKLGFRSIREMVGHVECLHVNEEVRNFKTQNLDLSAILVPAHTLRQNVAMVNNRKQDHLLHTRLDNKLIFEAESALANGESVYIDGKVVNTDRAVGATLSYQISKKYGEQGLPDGTIHVKLTGSAGQSFGAFLAPGVMLELEGDSNDYVGKGLSGGCVVIYPPANSSFKSEENIIVGNVCLYGATSGRAFIRGIAAERFCVRNSGAIALVEGLGDHGCEYMTGGRAIILGSTGRNFAAGMSGGIAYVLDVNNDFRPKCNMEMVELDTVNDDEEIRFLKSTIEDHFFFTKSSVAERVLKNFSHFLPKFVRVMPTDYKRVLEESKQQSILSTPKLVESVKDLDIGKPGEHEPAILDIEDTAVDGEAQMKRVAKLDKLKGFMKYKRKVDAYRNPQKRLKDWKEVNNRLTKEELRTQAARCMDCGIPFCQSDNGCPIGNVIPKWNELIFKDQWKDALERLMMTNNFPEFTGRVCPAPCEGACVLGINELPVSIKSIEAAIIDRGFEQGWIVPRPPNQRSGKKVAIIGSGPAGLAAADQLNKAGHSVTVYDRNDRMGGLLMYGIPNMKLDKKIVQRRLDLLAAEGIAFVPNANIGTDVDANQIRSENDAMLIATGATWPRDLPIANRHLDGIHFAMEFLQLNTQSLMDSNLENGRYISAKDKHVVVIGGGDTGCDCIGTSARHGALSITNFELLPQPPAKRAKENPWPQFPRVFKVDYGHAEVQLQYGKDPREYCILSKEFVSDGNGRVKGINTVQVEWVKDDAGRWTMNEIPNSERFFKADLVLLSMGFLGPEEKLIQSLNLKTNKNTTIETPVGKYGTSLPGIFAAGDCRRGQSLIVWGIDEGRQAAREVDSYLMGSTFLPATGGIKQRALQSASNEAHSQKIAV